MPTKSLAKTEETPPGVILVIVLSPELLVYILPESSTTIHPGLGPVVPRVERTPPGVILVTVSP